MLAAAETPAPARGARPLSPVTVIQRQLEAVYGLDRSLDAERYVLRRSAYEADGRHLLGAEGGSVSRREALLVAQHKDGVELALVLDDALADARAPLGLDAFCAVAEGVSHLLYVALAAERELPVSALELELQAEIDKFALLVLYGRLPLQRAVDRLFTGWELDADVTEPGERERYATASQLAHGFCRGALTRLVQRSGVEALLGELRHVYRLTGHRKRERVARA